MSFIHANDPAMGNLSYPRAALDHYPTPEWVTEAVIPTLLSLRSKSTPVWEPACGEGAMSTVLAKYFDNVRSTDLADYGFGKPGLDFLKTEVCMEQDSIIVTNPPYGDLAEDFIRHALRLTKPLNGVVAMVLRNEYDSSKGRVGLFNAPPFCKKLVLTSRPRWVADSTGSPRHNYSWFIFDWLHSGPASLSYHVRPSSSA